MRLLFIALFLFASINNFACVCAPQQPFTSAEDLKGYDFIALAEIKELAPVSNRLNLRANGDVTISIMELFKGMPQNMLYDPSFNSDCAMGLMPNQQWLFFGTTRNGHMEISSCNYSVLYRSEQNERDWRSFRGFHQLDLIRKIFNKPETGKSEGSVFYPSGQLEIRQVFAGEKLNGIRNIYYPSGKLYVTEDFLNGERKSFRRVYAESGQLLEDISYDKGLKTQVTFYDDTARAARMAPMLALKLQIIS